MNEILQTLTNLWLWDVAVFSKPVMYWPLLIPATCYLMFFFVKWAVITAPLWFPIYLIVGLFFRNYGERTEKELDRLRGKVENLEDLLEELQEDRGKK